MQSLDVQNPGIPDLQFVLLVLALSTSDLDSLNLPGSVRKTLFNRCWALVHETPPPEKKEERVLDLRHGDELTLEAMVQMIQRTLKEHGIFHLTWDHPPSEPTRSTTPEAKPLVERLQKLYPTEPDQSESTPSGPNS
jgi:hypothetical protein